MICSWLIPSLAFKTPWVSSAISSRYLLATARPAGSSPELLMRYPEVNCSIVWVWKVLFTLQVLLRDQRSYVGLNRYRHAHILCDTSRHPAGSGFSLIGYPMYQRPTLISARSCRALKTLLSGTGPPAPQSSPSRPRPPDSPPASGALPSVVPNLFGRRNAELYAGGPDLGDLDFDVLSDHDRFARAGAGLRAWQHRKTGRKAAAVPRRNAGPAGRKPRAG